MKKILAGLTALTTVSLLMGCGGTAVGPGKTAPGGGHPPVADEALGAIAGRWHTGSLSGVNYYDPATGRWSDASGTSQILTLRADGTYEEVGYLSVTTYSCTSKLFVEEKGNLTRHGNRLTFTPKSSRAWGYTCSPSNAYEQRDHIKPWSRDYVAGGGTLTLTDPEDGGSTTWTPMD
ncbi:hypothetical protein HNR42_002695 [Deinobacterium chartae]|uniref:Lipoprotein n=1 Tax=Deinobacterium chartae TaxID=521158 RepID=A0A841I0R1_9DEIO|nr:hypothetical protein [Deinobacterium chartae]MBB6099257.1 hypothetical protein [Deinobacterium chartae]